MEKPEMRKTVHVHKDLIRRIKELIIGMEEIGVYTYTIRRFVNDAIEAKLKQDEARLR